MYFKYAFGSLLLLSLMSAGLGWKTPTHTLDARTETRASTTSLERITGKTATTSTSTEIAVRVKHAWTQKHVSAPKKTAQKPPQKPILPPAATTATTTPATSTKATTAPTTTPPIQTAPPVASENSFASQVEAFIHAGINKERQNNGLPALNYSAQIASLALSHSADMHARNYFNHADPDGCNIECRFGSIKYAYWTIGENIFSMSGYHLSAEKTAQFIVDGWMQSPGHRANILNKNFTFEGIGVTAIGDEVLATEDFALPR